jgi:hypothetical protein
LSNSCWASSMWWRQRLSPPSAGPPVHAESLAAPSGSRRPPSNAAAITFSPTQALPLQRVAAGTGLVQDDEGVPGPATLGFLQCRAVIRRRCWGFGGGPRGGRWHIRRTANARRPQAMARHCRRRAETGTLYPWRGVLGSPAGGARACGARRWPCLASPRGQRCFAVAVGWGPCCHWLVGGSDEPEKVSRSFGSVEMAPAVWWRHVAK